MPVLFRPDVFESQILFFLDNAGIKVHNSNDFLFHFRHLLVHWRLTNFKLFLLTLDTEIKTQRAELIHEPLKHRGPVPVAADQLFPVPPSWF